MALKEEGWKICSVVSFDNISNTKAHQLDSISTRAKDDTGRRYWVYSAEKDVETYEEKNILQVRHPSPWQRTSRGKTQFLLFWTEKSLKPLCHLFSKKQTLLEQSKKSANASSISKSIIVLCFVVLRFNFLLKFHVWISNTVLFSFNSKRDLYFKQSTNGSHFS